MFDRARTRLTLLYIGLFALVLGIFSAVFYVAFATVLAPAFDIDPDLTSEQAVRAAYDTTIQRIALALGAADVVALVLVGIVAWLLASRTLNPIRDAHARQRRFVADASHEMRTPLTAIRASAESTLGLGPTPAFRDAIAGIVTSVERLSSLTNDLLILARTDELGLERRHDPFDLSVVTAEAVQAFMAARPGRPAPKLDLTPDLRVRGDADEVGRIVANLVENAYRYGNDDVTVRVSTSGSDREATTEVADDGPGIPGAELERIFEPFYRVEPRPPHTDGSGLGLAIARGLAQRNGGRLTVASRLGHGSTFRLSLPRFT